MLLKSPPLSLYIHLPWCVRKCPYCDFNSHRLPEQLPETAYVEALLSELDRLKSHVQDRKLLSIFFGGGTPSLFSPVAIKAILDQVAERIAFAPDIEITLEANPGTVDESRFLGFYHAGINRLSLGAQSFQADKLKVLGRIHGPDHIFSAVNALRQAGFSNFNIDLMFGLPQQSAEEALADLSTAIALAPTHLSWYQLTLEPNTLFHAKPPVLPDDETIWEMQLQGQKLLTEHAYLQYEVSAYAQSKKQCLHNYNYWTFGDYLGIGAGAHSKITDIQQQKIIRFAQVKHPKDYLDANKRKQFSTVCLTENDLTFEFMLNALRLNESLSFDLFTERTGLDAEVMAPLLAKASKKKLLTVEAGLITKTALGHQFLNDLVQVFLP